MNWRKRISGARTAIAARYLLLGLALAWFVSAKPEVSNVAHIETAHASVPVGAAVSYLSFTTKDVGEGKFFITDTAKKVILTYSLNGEQLRLVSARKFDEDLRLVDGTIKAPESLESIGQGLTRDDVKTYAKNSKAQLDALAKRLGKDQMQEAE